MQRPHARMRSFNKHVLNPVMLKFAGSAPGPFAVIRHVGRRSGKRYETPIIVRPTVTGFVIALTYGPEVDWLRNLQAAGRGTLLCNGRAYAIEQPESLDRQTALPAFPRVLRLLLRRFGIQDFLRVRSSAVAPTA